MLFASLIKIRCVGIVRVILQKVIRHGLLGRHTPRVLRRGFEHAIPPSRPTLRCLIPQAKRPRGIAIAARGISSVGATLAELENGGHVTAAVAVIRCGPDSDDGAFEHFLEALHDELMGARNQTEVVPVVEMLDNVGAEEEARAAGREAPAVDIVWV